jgi:hypothetical protein
MTTLTAYPGVLEENPPDKAGVIHTLHALADRFGPERVLWRYDPVLLSSLTTREFHLSNFKNLSQALKGAITKVIISGYDEYPRTRRRMERLESRGSFRLLPMRDAALHFLPETRKLLGELSALADEAGMSMRSCAEEEDLTPLGISGGACIDSALIKKLWGIESAGKTHQRGFCRCAPSIDIGSYGACPALCAYCYAR